MKTQINSVLKQHPATILLVVIESLVFLLLGYVAFKHFF